MATEDDKTFQRVLFGLAENTGMHGLPNISRSKSLVRKFFWLLILCAGLSKYSKIITTVLIQIWSSSLRFVEQRAVFPKPLCAINFR